jgi:beta-lactamase class A
MTLAELCEATMATSDNTAGNLVLRAAGGPEGLTAYLRSIGDGVTRLDRWETALNEAQPGDPRDTTSPAAMTATLEKLVLGTALSPASRNRLTGWLFGNRVSDPKLKAGLPGDWRVADRTGAGGFGTNNVAGIVYPPSAAPVLVGIFITETSASAAETNAAMAEIARALRETLAT